MLFGSWWKMENFIKLHSPWNRTHISNWFWPHLMNGILVKGMDHVCQWFRARFIINQQKMLPTSRLSKLSSPSFQKKKNLIFFRTSRNITVQKESGWGKFMQKFNAQWNVAQIVQRVKTDATITFDFVTLILVAG